MIRRRKNGGGGTRKHNHIVVRGAAEHNLKGFDVEIPRNRLSVVTGLSGSGKSSLAYDIIYREGQRRFVESLSAYARQYLGKLDKPRVEHVEGLSPTISIDQKTISRNPRSTVGTITEILDHLRLLYARLGTPHCPDCGDEITSRTVDQIVDVAYRDWAGADVLVCAPLILDRKGEYRKELGELKEQGFVRARIDGNVHRLDEEIELARYERHTIEVVYDRVRLDPDRRPRFTESVEKALALADGLVNLVVDEEAHLMSARFACVKCGNSVPELEPRLFSFNSHGACRACNGLGRGYGVDVGSLIPDPEYTLSEDAICTFRDGVCEETGIALDELQDLGFDIDSPWKKLRKSAQQKILHGDAKQNYRGLVPHLIEAATWNSARSQPTWLVTERCHTCDGTRLGPPARAVRFRDHDIATVTGFTVEDAQRFFEALQLTEKETLIGGPIVTEVVHRLQFLQSVGLSYLTLERSADTLSGGEAQRIRLASQLGSGLRGVLYVLDEPSIGLHPRDNRALIETLRRLRDLGNTVLVVEHDQETIEAADHIVDVGPGAGSFGGELVASGSLSTVKRCKESLTGRYLRGLDQIEIPEERRNPDRGAIQVRGARQHNLKNIDVDFPIGAFIGVVGVSGSGKSTLVDQILYRTAMRHVGWLVPPPGEHDRVDGLDEIDKVIRIDQSPIGRTPRSNPGTYTKVFDEIRTLFASIPEAKVRGYQKGRFSFNVKGGRCENCGGAGVNTISMQFLASVEVTCEECDGRRYTRETLEVTYRGLSIYDVLELPISEAAEFFRDLPKIHRVLQTLVDVGLGYVKLGQPSTTLSGGEAQRIKLAHELRKIATGNTLYVLDEPTTGLHFEDTRKLLECLQRLVDAGNTVVVIEHSLDVIKVVDHLIELGPGGGAEGGELIASGTPEALAELDTPTGIALAELFRAQPRPLERAGKKSGSGGGEPEDRFIIAGARENNLKNIDVEIPRGQLTVITGPSGSGKSTLAFDILFAEGQRRYVESLSTYARRFLGRMNRAHVDRVEGIAPAISIDQKNTSTSPRSTVATTTEIYDYLRLLFARVGTPHCPECDRELLSASPSVAARRIEEELSGERAYILAPLIPEPGEELAAAAERLLKEGFVRAWAPIASDDKSANGSDEIRLEEFIDSLKGDDATSPDLSSIFLVVDRLVPGKVDRNRLTESVEEAYRRGGDRVVIRVRGSDRELHFHRLPACPAGHFAQQEELTPRLFSFNHHSGACPRCDGLGIRRELTPELLVNEPGYPLLYGAMDHRLGNWISNPKHRVHKVLVAACKAHDVDLDYAYEDLDDDAKKIIFDGTGDQVYAVRFRRFGGGKRRGQGRRSEWEGLRAAVARWHRRAESPNWRAALEEFMTESNCSGCGGGRLRKDLLRVRVADQSIGDVCRMTVQGAAEFFATLPLSKRAGKIAEEVLREIRNRLQFLDTVGLGYLNLDRRTATLSGGEAQRIRLATQIGNRLAGVLYVLDEPTIGLHQRDNERLLDSLVELRDLGNSVVIVEHDSQTIERADHVVDLGPGAGNRGGSIVATGSPQQIEENPNSVTGPYLVGERGLETPSERRPGDGGALKIRGAATNNLKEIDVEIPTGTLTVVTGVSGSGKSSLVMEILANTVEREYAGKRVVPGPHATIDGLDAFEQATVIDQTPIGRSPSSNAATYTGLFTPVRTLFARLPVAKARGYGKGRFSYNVAGGRCEACEGKGARLVEMHFLSDIWVTCDVCGGARYDRETLAVRFKGHTIADVLQMEVSEAAEVFENHPEVGRMLRVLEDVGLGYLPLGQSATTLSGGEAQRVKLAAALGKARRGPMLYILDEPTTGLHFADVEKLVAVLQRFADRGDTVVVIEHNLEVIKCADHIIDLGPEGGDGGGEVVTTGTPEEVATDPASHTGRYLKPLLGAVGEATASKGASKKGTRKKATRKKAQQKKTQRKKRTPA